MRCSHRRYYHGQRNSGQLIRDFAATAITVCPYSQTADLSQTLGQLAGIAEVAAQKFGTTGSTFSAIQSLAAAAEDGKPINVTAFSGGATAFTEAVNWLNANGGSQIVGLINNITYVSPGAFGSLYNNGNAIALIGTGYVDVGAGFFTDFGGISTGQVSACGHDFQCMLTHSSILGSRSGDGCSNPQIINQPITRIANRNVPGFYNPYLDGTLFDVTPWVTSTFRTN